MHSETSENLSGARVWGWGLSCVIGRGQNPTYEALPFIFSVSLMVWLAALTASLGWFPLGVSHCENWREHSNGGRGTALLVLSDCRLGALSIPQWLGRYCPSKGCSFPQASCQEGSHRVHHFAWNFTGSYHLCHLPLWLLCP